MINLQNTVVSEDAMTLQEWIRKQGGQRECARRFKFPAASIEAWYQLERFPRPSTQQKLNRLAEGEIDFRRLMKDYIIAQEKKRKKRVREPLPILSSAITSDCREHLLSHVLAGIGMRCQQPDWQARLIYASWVGKNITPAQFRQAAASIKTKGSDSVDLFYIDKIIK
jgi:hypothetical protein